MLKNKLLIILFITFLLLITTFSSFSFASISFEGKSFPEFPEGFNDAKYKFIIYSEITSDYLCFFTNNDEPLFYSIDSGKLHILDCYSYKWAPSSNTDSWLDFYYGNADLIGWSGYPEGNVGRILIYSNFDIKFDGIDDIFFIKPPY